ncbi:MAG: cohesin domain-containing protein [Clostridia bacterium]|nr:cohesin domain-containing protein [Clostridia bacterium]
MKNRIKMLMLSILLITLMFLISAASCPDLNDKFPELEIKIINDRDNMIMDLSIKGIEGLYGYAVEIVFDNSIIEVDKIDEEDIFSKAKKNSMLAVDEYDNFIGRISYAKFLLGEEEGAKGSGKLLSIKFNVKKEDKILFEFIQDREKLEECMNAIYVKCVDKEGEIIIVKPAKCRFFFLP